jgi:nucleoside-diphosphate-sugar epimerase
MKILVTGSEGSLMQAVIPHLLAAGHKVVGADNFFRYGKSVRNRQYEFVEGDLTDSAFAPKVVQGAEGVIQAAARIFGVRGFHKYPADILGCDVRLHHNVLQAALEQGIPKVCYISSSMVFERCTRHPSAEDDVFESLVPRTDYGLSKMVGERLSMAYAKQYGLKYVVWRPFNIITPFEKGEDEQGISHVFADFVRLLILEKRNPLSIFGDGQQIRCFTWIDDVARAIAQHSFEPVTDNQAYNLGNAEPITMMRLAEIIYAEGKAQGAIPADAGELRFEHKPIYSDDVKIRIPRVDKAREQLGWTATVKVKEAVKRCVAEAVRAGR